MTSPHSHRTMQAAIKTAKAVITLLKRLHCDLELHASDLSICRREHCFIGIFRCAASTF